MDDLCATLERTPRRLRRRRQALGLLAALAAVAALLTTFRGPERPVPAECHSTSDPLREAWSPDRRQAVHRAFLGAGAPRAREVWLHTDERLGEYARLLGDRFAIGCRESADGARPPEVLERVFTCLLERRAALGAAVQVLSRAEVQTTFAAEAVLATLPSLAACDPGNPRFGVEEMPRDPTRLASLREVRARLAEVAVLRAGGRYDEALERARPAVETAERLGLRWLVAEALYGLGSVLGHTVDLAGAERALERALWAAEASGNDALAQHAWHTLAQVVGWGRGRYAEAERLARHAESYAERLGADRTELIYLRGVLRLQQGQLAEARTLLDRSLAERRPDDTLGKARSLNQLAILWLALGDPAKALELANRTLALRQERLGPDHPRVAGTMVVVGAVLEATGDLDGALRHYERSLALRERVHGPQHRAVGRILARLASLCVTRGDLARADALFERTLAIQRRYLGATHPDVFLTWNELGRLRTAQGRLGEAQALYRKVLATARPDLEAQRAGALEGLGKALVAAGRPGEALPHLEEALELRARRPEIVDALAHSRLALARGLAAGGREPGRARALVAEAGRDPSRLCARCRKELSVLEARLRDRFP
jgi:tetratricopeptide (TPR) repeat protein